MLCGLSACKLNSIIFSTNIIDFFFLCFEHVHRKKNHVVDYLAKQKVFREVDLVVWL
jgi:hypothetical protein